MVTTELELEVGNLSDEYRTLYTKSYDAIKTRISAGKIKTVYHFILVGGYSKEKMKEFLDIVKTRHSGGCKLNVAFGMFLRSKETAELRFFHPSNNSLLFKEPKIIKDDQSFTDLLNELEMDDVFGYATTHRPSTKWVVDRIVCVRFDVYRTKQYTL